MELVSGWDLPAEDIARAERGRQLLQQAVEALRPASVFSGHWHQRVKDVILHPDGTETRVDVLEMNGSRGGNAVLAWPDSPLRIEPLIVGGRAR